MKTLYLFFTLLLFSTIVTAQNLPKQFEKKFIITKEEEEILQEAEFLFQEGDYPSALPLFLKLERSYPGEPLYTYRVGICYLNKKPEENKAIYYLEQTKKDIPETPDLFYHLGRAYQLSYSFDKAIGYFNEFIQKDPKSKRIAEAKMQINYCTNAKALVNQPNKSKVENLGDSINTLYSEYAPVITDNGKMMYYTFRGDSLAINNRNENIRINPLYDYYEDVYAVTQTPWNGWSIPKRLGAPFNSGKKGVHDASVSISDDGKFLFLYKDNSRGVSGDLILLEKKGDTWTNPKLLDNINTRSWEGSASMSIDNSFIIFASDRAGGLGGRDLYISKRLANGEFDKPVNLGPSVNTPYNDDAPFISQDSKVLYFSSEGHNSIGGYDIFKCDVSTDFVFSNVKNLGYPINSIEDDIYLTTTLDGKIAYMSSSRAGGFGQLDLFQFETGRMNEFTYMVHLSGHVTAEQKPCEAVLHIYNDDGTLQGTYSTGILDGSYTAKLVGGNRYKLVYSSHYYDGKTENLDVMNITASVEKVIDVELLPHQEIAAVSKEEPKKEILTDTTTKTKTEETTKKDVVADNATKKEETGKQDVLAENITKTDTKKTDTTTPVKTGPEDNATPQSLKVEKIYFSYDQTKVNETHKPNLNEVAAFMVKNKDYKIEITGHTDAKGSDDYNTNLSKQRASTVADYLAVRGVSRARMITSYKGESMPLAPNENTDGSDNPEGRGKNRRVELKLSSSKSSEVIKIEYRD